MADNWGFFYRAPYKDFKSEYLRLEKVNDFSALSEGKAQQLCLAMALFAVLREKHHLQRDAYSYDEFVEFSQKCHGIYSVSSLRNPSSDKVLHMLLDGVDGVSVENARKVMLRNPEFVVKVLEDSMKDFCLGELKMENINRVIEDGFKQELSLPEAGKMMAFDDRGNPLVKDSLSSEDCF